MSTYSPDLRIELITTGDQAGTWGNTTNTNLSNVIEQAIAGYVSVSVTSANQAFTYINGGSPTAASNQAVFAAIALTTTTAANFAVYAPPASKLYIIYNASAYVATIYNSTVIGNTTAAGTGVAIPAGKVMTVWSDGTNFAVQNSHVIGTVVGNVTGNVTGDVSGNVTGNVTGNLTGNVTGDLTGDVTGDVTGNVTGNLTGTASNVADGAITTNKVADVAITEIKLASGVAAANLGFNPVQQGTGIGQLGNSVKIGWSGSRLLAQVDATDIGPFVMQNGFEGSNQSLGGNGYQKLPGGLIMQWGSFSQSSSTTSVSFPVSFPNACLNVQQTLAGGASVSAPGVGALTTTGFVSIRDTVVPNLSCYFFAIGY